MPKCVPCLLLAPPIPVITIRAHTITVPGPAPSSSRAHSFHPHNNLAAGDCCSLRFRSGKLRHREVNCLWSSDVNLDILAVSVCSAAFPRGNTCHFPNPKPWTPVASPESGSNGENNPQAMREKCFFLPRLPKPGHGSPQPGSPFCQLTPLIWENTIPHTGLPSPATGWSLLERLS